RPDRFPARGRPSGRRNPPRLRGRVALPGGNGEPPMNDDPVIQTRDLTKSYGPITAVRSLNLTVRPNRITGFLGRNGAGKSTTIKMLLGMIRPSAGSGTVAGRQISDPAQNVELRRRVAYVSEDKRLYDYMTVEQMIRFTSGFYADFRADAAHHL